jgi:hypothetical protein
MCLSKIAINRLAAAAAAAAGRRHPLALLMNVAFHVMTEQNSYRGSHSCSAVE